MDTKRVKQAVLVQSTGILRIVACLAGVIGYLAAEGINNQAVQAQAVQPHAQPQTAPVQTSVTETGCRQTNSVTGVYAQPSLDSNSRGILNTGQTLRLEQVGTGTGWARVAAPLIGWVEAKYLTPASACTGLGATATAPSGAPSIRMSTLPQSAPQAALPQVTVPSATPTATAVCEVLPTEGLVVRSEPAITASTALYTIPKGIHQFQFTSDHITGHSGNNIERHWAYITAPYPGWISIGVVGGRSNLGGKECG
jgi:hypothetical protein